MIISHKYKFIFVKTTKVGGTSLELYLSSVCSDSAVATPFWHPEKGHQPRNYSGLFNPIFELQKRVKCQKKKLDHGIVRTVNEFLKGERFYEPMPAWQIRCSVPSEIWDNYYKFTIERNPFDKITSRYFHSKRVYEKKYSDVLTFDKWYNYFKDRINKPWITKAWGSEAPFNYPRYADPWTDEILVDRILRYENLTEELDDVFKMLGVPLEGKIPYRAKGQYRRKGIGYKELIPDQHLIQIHQIFHKELQLMDYCY